MDAPCVRYQVRELTSADAQTCAEFVGNLERSDLGNRFGHTSVHLPLLLPSVRPEANGRALGAFEGSDILLGVVNLEHLAGGDAEVAIIVRSDFKRRGAGHCLMSKAIELARNAGVRRLVGYVSPENSAVAALAQKFGFRLIRVDRFFTEIVLPIS